MDVVTIVVVTVGLILLAVGFALSLRLRARGGVAVYSRPWYTAVILAGAGCGLVAASTVPLLWSR